MVYWSGIVCFTFHYICSDVLSSVMTFFMTSRHISNILQNIYLLYGVIHQDVALQTQVINLEKQMWRLLCLPQIMEQARYV